MTKGGSRPQKTDLGTTSEPALGEGVVSFLPSPRRKAAMASEQPGLLPMPAPAVNTISPHQSCKTHMDSFRSRRPAQIVIQLSPHCSAVDKFPIPFPFTQPLLPLSRSSDSSHLSSFNLIRTTALGRCLLQSLICCCVVTILSREPAASHSGSQNDIKNTPSTAFFD